MTDLNIDKLENEAMARAYNTNKPDELKENQQETMTDKNNVSFFKISQLINNDIELDQKQFSQGFRYIKMMDCDWSCHYALLLNNKIGMIIPQQYVIIYGESSLNDLNHGIVKFRSEKEYQVEYEASTEEEFELRMNELKIVSTCIEKFENNDQIFYEFDNGYIYMYYDGYIWKISNFSRNDIKEYYDMYIILMSIRTINNKHYNDKDNLKLIYLISKNCLNYLYKGIDLKKKRKEEIDEYALTEDVVTFSIDNERYLTVLDEDYQIFKRKTNEETENFEKLHIYCDDEWCFEGTFKASILGIYNSGYLLDFKEIVNSTELSEIEKRNLLENIINQKQIELYEYKDFISKKLLDILIENIKDNLTLDRWNELEFVNYLYVEDIDIENKTEELLYDFYKFALDNNDIESIKKTIDIDYLSNQIKPIKVVISSEFMAFSCNIFNKNKTFILFENNEFIEWK